VAFADEIVVVDSASTEATAAIAQRRGARVVQREWLGFGRQKQFCRRAGEARLGAVPGRRRRVSPTSRQAFRPRSPRRWRRYTACAAQPLPRRWLAHGEGYPDWSPRLSTA